MALIVPYGGNIFVQVHATYCLTKYVAFVTTLY